MSKKSAQRDPRGHSLRVYADVYDSAAFAALSPHDVLAYMALLRELKGYNNGDLSLPLSRAKNCGINHPKTLARSLRALCAVGLVAITRKGGCQKGGQRLASLYRVTDRECYAIPAKHLEAMPATDEWKRVASVQQGHDLIAAAEAAVKVEPEKTQSLGHRVKRTGAPDAMVKPKTRAPREPWNARPGHGVNMVKSAKSLGSMRATSRFHAEGENAIHRAPHSTPLYVYQSTGQNVSADGQGAYRRLTAKPAHLFTGLVNSQNTATH